MDRIHPCEVRTVSGPVVVGICGLIGSGKSVVSRLLRLENIQVYDCDVEARRIMDNNRDIHAALRRIAGKEVVVTRDGCSKIDRNLLAVRMFSDKAVLERVNTLIHGRVREDFRRWALSRKGEKVVGVESAIMVTSGMAPACDVLWYVAADELTRQERIVERNATTVERARQWMAAQLPEQRALEELCSGGDIPVVHISNVGAVSLLKSVSQALGYIDRLNVK